MSSYPKIYSLSTVGVRQHYNTDFLLHDVRTDFTGDNGLGKSIIADLLQLIFVPKRDLWKPGTEGIDKNDRRIETIPLNKEFVNFAYAFLNIEKSKGKFIVIGVYIPKKQVPVRPFVVQKSPDFSDKRLITFEFPLKANDFLSDANAILDLDNLKRKLLLNDLYLKDFYQSEQIMDYFDLLYKNQILQIDLTRENNLKTFAKVLQSFSRAKTLDINNSKSLQAFLFEDNEDIKNLFEEQKEQLESYIKQYRRDTLAIADLNRKQTRLNSLKALFDMYVLAKEEYLSKDALNASSKYREAEKNERENRERLERAKESLVKYQAEERQLTAALLELYCYLKQTCLLSKKNCERLLREFSDDKINNKNEENGKLIKLIGRIEAVEAVYSRYNNSIQAIEIKLAEQNKVKKEKERLDGLKKIKHFNDFVNSEWAVDYLTARQFYKDKLNQLSNQISETKSILELYESDNPNSFFYWAINQKVSLNLEQETIMMYLKELAINQPDKFIKGTRFIVNPSDLINSYEQAANGILLKLGEIREFVPYNLPQKFDNVHRIKSVLENDKTELKRLLEALNDEFTKLQELESELNTIGYNQECLEIWKSRQRIEEYIFDAKLNEEVLNQITEIANDIANLQTLRTRQLELQTEITDMAKQQSRLKDRSGQIDNIIFKCGQRINKIKDEVILPIKEIVVDESKTLEELEFLKEKYEADIEQHEALLEATKANTKTQEGIIGACNEKKDLLEDNLRKTEGEFNRKKLTLEKETELKFDQLLILREYSDELIVDLQQKFIDSQTKFYEEYTSITQSFDETKDKRNPELENDKYNFHTLVRILCGKLGLEGLGPELEKLTEELLKFGDLQLKIILDVFGRVEREYEDLKILVNKLNLFFKENKISNSFHFKIDFIERKDISIEWIRRMKEIAKVKTIGRDLFTQLEEKDENLSPEQLIINIAKNFSSVKSCDLAELLNPKFYFNLQVGLYDDDGQKNTGSGGQAYTALALLCIGRLSIIQSDGRQGIQFIIIEELSNIDDKNFNIFPDIAKQFGYQLLTMTPKPFGGYTNDDWFLHMLSKGHDKYINYQPMSFFKTRNSRELLEEYLQRNELENTRKP